jgi:hypothetical protein
MVRNNCNLCDENLAFDGKLVVVKMRADEPWLPELRTEESKRQNIMNELST